MKNPYTYETEFDNLGTDDSIIDYCYLSENGFLLIFLLASNADLQAFYEVGSTGPRKKIVNLRSFSDRNINPKTICVAPDASFIVLGLADGDILVIPLKILLDVTWSTSSAHSTLRAAPVLINFISPGADSLQVIPTSMKCFMTKFPPRPSVVLTNKKGSIYLIDLESRKCVAELTALESLHKVDIISNPREMTTDVLVTSFMGAQWIIPLENNGRGYNEVLTTSDTNDFKKLDSTIFDLSVQNSNLVAIKEDTVQLYQDISFIDQNILKSYKIPQDTRLALFTDDVVFVVSGQSELRSAVHFGLKCVRLDYTLVRNIAEWRILGLIPLPRLHLCLSSCMIVNERGLMKLFQCSELTLAELASEFLFRVPVFSMNKALHVAEACSIQFAEFKRSIIPCLLKSRKNTKICKKDLSKILIIAKVLEIAMEELIDIFSATSHENCLLSQILSIIDKNVRSPLRVRVIELYARKCLNERDRDDYETFCQENDEELSLILSRFPDVVSDINILLQVPLWKSSCIIAGRSREATEKLIEFLSNNGENIWKGASRTIRSQVLSCIFQLDWSGVESIHGERILNLLCVWQKDFLSSAHYEHCVRIAGYFRTKFPRQSSALYLLSSVYLLSESPTDSKISSVSRRITCGLNSSAVITLDDRVTVWGDIINKQRDFNDVINISQRSSSPDSSNSLTNTVKLSQLPHSIYMEGRPHTVGCGSEHVLVLTTSNQLFAWGTNRYGQCGVGHSNPINEPQLLDTVLPAIKSISCGQYHCAILCEDASLWTWGWGLYGQLGQGSRFISDIYVPTQVKLDSYCIISVSCGRAHTLALTDDGTVLITGNSSYGQSGSSDDIRKIYQFRPIDIGAQSPKFVKIATKFYHSVGVTDDNRILEWGRNPRELKMKTFVMKRMKNANRIKTEERTIPRDCLGWRETKHLLNGRIADLSTGLSHSAIITDCGSLFTWGKGLDYQLGHGSKTERSEPHQVFEPVIIKWKHVECGGNHTIAVTEDGRCYGWGRNDMTQCGFPSNQICSAPRKYFYQPKDGTKRCVQLPDDSSFVQKPSLIADIYVKLSEHNNSSVFNQKEFFEQLEKAEYSLLKFISRHLEQSISPQYLLCSLPVAFCHLLAGNLDYAIDQIGRATHAYGETESVLAITSLAWEILANHEEAQTNLLLQKAFEILPLSNTQRNSSQLRNLWPNVWATGECQRDLSSNEKLSILENWIPEMNIINSVEIPNTSLQTGSVRLRVWGQCGHVEPAAVGIVQECSICTDEWQHKVEAALGDTG
ncbi:unnamed protein product [Auanema sp. JU1783]|nr:unnamed protein product [Auanema sp. JU1783]